MALNIAKILLCRKKFMFNILKPAKIVPLKTVYLSLPPKVLLTGQLITKSITLCSIRAAITIVFRIESVVAYLSEFIDLFW